MKVRKTIKIDKLAIADALGLDVEGVTVSVIEQPRGMRGEHVGYGDGPYLSVSWDEDMDLPRPTGRK